MLVNEKRIEETKVVQSHLEESKNEEDKSYLSFTYEKDKKDDNYLVTAMYSKNLVYSPVKLVKFNRNLKTKLWKKGP